MTTFQLSSLALSSSSSTTLNLSKKKPLKLFNNTKPLRLCRGKRVIKAISTVPESDSEVSPEAPSVDFAFVASVMMPDDSPDVQFRTTRGGQNLRRIMLDANIDLYGPYDKTLSNCAGGGCCGTCMVEVIQGRELLSPRTDKEMEKLKKKPRNWRLACQTTVGKPDSEGMVVIQQLPEWKAHEWTYERVDPKLLESAEYDSNDKLI